MGHDVFLSYSKPDKVIADALCATLESHGIRCWIAPRDVTPGVDWGEAIVRAISRCKIMVLVFSSHANESPQVQREVQRAFERGLTVIPLRVEDVSPVASLEYYIGPVHWLDALTPPLERHLRSLASQVQSLLASNEDVRLSPRRGPSGRGVYETVLYEQLCGYASPEFRATFRGKCFPFQGEGHLRLTTHSLCLEGCPQSLEIALHDVKSIGQGRLWLQCRLKYLIVNYTQDGDPRAIHLFPFGTSANDQSKRVTDLHVMLGRAMKTTIKAERR
jgi:hypothetical protein